MLRVNTSFFSDPMRRFLRGLLCALAVLTGTAAAPASDTLSAPTTVIRVAYADSTRMHPDVLRFRELRRPRVAIVLSGGGARGMAQIGVLKVLERHHIPVDFIASTSVGALIGGLYAAGYTSAELERLVLTTNWDDLLSLSDETKRSELFVDQKIIGERSFIAIRFQGFEPVIPPAVSSGQRLTDFLNSEVLQAPFHAIPDFDHLKIPFRAVATDLISGKKIVLRDGSLAEALRGSATVPLLFNPIEKGGMKLIDGGLVDNIPVDLARQGGYDLVIAVNSTSGLRREDEMAAPWQTADQIVGIMMERMKAEQLKGADIVITPDIGRHLSSDFRGLDSLIAAGEHAAEAAIPQIETLLRQKTIAMDPPDTVFPGLRTENIAEGIDTTSDVWQSVARDTAGPVHTESIRENLFALFQTGYYEDVYATVIRDSARARVRYVGVPYPVLSAVRLEGARLVPPSTLLSPFAALVGHSLNHTRADAAVDSLLRMYRARGYSLAQVDSAKFNESSGALTLWISEGKVADVTVDGGVRTQDEFVLNEFPVQKGDVFQIDRAKRGLTNIISTNLFEYVYLEVVRPSSGAVLTIRLKERPSQLVRLGVRVDNERNLQGLIDIRDENFHGIGTDLGLTIAGGQRNLDALLGYKSRRLFNTYLTLGVSAFYRTRSSYLYADVPNEPENHWDRERVGEYRDIRYGAGVSFGTQLEKLGDATAEFILQNIRVASLDRAEALESRQQVSLLRVGTFVDTKDDYPFPTSGIGLKLSYEFAFRALGSDVSYTALGMMYEIFNSWGKRFTFHPRITLDFADRTMPFPQQFRLGGQDSFFGLREDDQRGRQLLLLNVEFRYLLPIRLLFDTYISARYDLGTISANPEEIKFSGLRHGIGAEVAFRTPLGPASLGAGKSFFFSKDLPQNPIQQGPLLFYFMVGYEL